MDRLSPDDWLAILSIAGPAAAVRALMRGIKHRRHATIWVLVLAGLIDILAGIVAGHAVYRLGAWAGVAGDLVAAAIAAAASVGTIAMQQLWLVLASWIRRGRAPGTPAGHDDDDFLAATAPQPLPEDRT